jgi:hypothetical protein
LISAIRAKPVAALARRARLEPAGGAARRARSRSASVARLAGGDFLALGGADFGELVGHAPWRLTLAPRSSSRAAPWPGPCRSPRRLLPPLAPVGRFARDDQRAGGVEQHRVAIGPGLALSSGAGRRRCAPRRRRGSPRSARSGRPASAASTRLHEPRRR